MFVPPYKVIMNSAEKLNNNESTSELINFLLRLVLINSDFSEKDYIEQNPDIKKALESGAIKSARMHFITTGYFEGRVAGAFAFDEKYYLSTYPDVAAAVRSGQVASAEEHYFGTGMYEFRSPTATAAPHVEAWKTALLNA
jgi:hypothetical protein